MRSQSDVNYFPFTLLEARLYRASAGESLRSQVRTEHANVTQSGPTIRKGDVVGRINIPKLGLSVAVLQGTSSRILRLGAGHIDGTPSPGEPGNSGVAGHRDTFFRGLKDIRKEDKIQLQTATKLVDYEMNWIKIVGPNDTAVLQYSGDISTLTLVTCSVLSSWLRAEAVCGAGSQKLEGRGSLRLSNRYNSAWDGNRSAWALCRRNHRLRLLFARDHSPGRIDEDLHRPPVAI